MEQPCMLLTYPTPSKICRASPCQGCAVFHLAFKKESCSNWSFSWSHPSLPTVVSKVVYIFMNTLCHQYLTYWFQKFVYIDTYNDRIALSVSCRRCTFLWSCLQFACTCTDSACTDSYSEAYHSYCQRSKYLSVPEKAANDSLLFKDSLASPHFYSGSGLSVGRIGKGGGKRK